MSTRALTEDELAVLEDQRDFLLRSLDDLEAEHAAGDVDDRDYEVLREDYTARAARVIRAIETHRAREPGPSIGRSGWRLAAVLAGVLLFAVGAGVLVAQTAGRRQVDETVTGDIRTTTRVQLNEAIQMAGQGEFDEAVQIYDAILAEQPDHVEAATYRGWTQVLSGDVSQGVVSLTGAAQMNPDYPDAHAFLAVAFFRLGNADAEQSEYFHDLARRELRRLDELDVPPMMENLLEPLRAELDR